MTTAAIRASLFGKLESLRQDLNSWRNIAVNDKDDKGKESAAYRIFAKHQSQILRLHGFFGGIIDTFAYSIDRLGAASYDEAGKISKGILQGHALWGYFREKLMLRYSRHVQKYLSAADEFAWKCFQPFQDARIAAGGLRARMVPPLIYLGEQVSPLVYVREKALKNRIREVSDDVYSEFMRSSPFSVVGLPFYQTTHLPETMVLAHEIGHVVDLDLDLTEDLDAALESVPDSAIPTQRKEDWKRCRIEAFADLFGAVTAGVAFCRSLSAFLATDRKTIVEEKIRAPTGGKRDRFTYPTRYLRVLLVLEALRKPDGSLPDEAGKIEELWRHEYGDDHACREFEADLPALAACLTDQPLEKLGNASIRQVGDYSSENDADALQCASGMLNYRTQPSPNQDHVRVLFAAAALAFYHDPEKYVKSGVEQIVLDEVEVHAERKARSREAVSQSDTDADHSAGAALAGLLGD